MQRSHRRSPCWTHCLKLFNGNAAKDGQRFSLNLCNISKGPPFKSLFIPGNKKKSPKERSRESKEGGGEHNNHFVFRQKRGVLLILQRFNENRWTPLTVFPFKILDNVSSSGRGAGIASSSHRGRTLKGPKVSNLYEYFK